MSRRKRRESISAAAQQGRRQVGASRSQQTDGGWLRIAIAALIALKIAGLVLLFDAATALAFEGPKSSFSLATTSLLAGLIVLILLREGRAALPQSPLNLAVLAFVLACAAATLVAEDRYLALFGAQRRLGLTFILDLAVLYLALAVALRERRQWALIGGAVALSGAVAMAYAVLQAVGLDPVPWTEDTSVRPPSTFGNPDKFGHFLGASLMAAAGLALVRTIPRWVRVAAGAYAVAALGVSALVATRGTVVGVAVAIPALGIVALRLSGLQPTRRAVVVLAGAGVGVLTLAVVLTLATPLGDRVRGGFSDPGTRQRVFVAEGAISAFRERPVLGWGPDNFGVAYPRHRPTRSVAEGGLVQQDSAHSLPLQTLATTGALGAISLAAVALGTLVALWRALPMNPHLAAPLITGAVAYWAQSAVAFGSISVDWMGWLAAGGAASLGVKVPSPSQRRIQPVMRAAVLVAALAMLVSGYAAFAANRELYAARVARTVGRPERAVQRAEQAIALDPGRAEHWFALGLARQDRGMLGEAASALRAATERAPHSSVYWSTLALTLANLSRAGDQGFGGRDAAIAAARRATEVDPNYPTPYNVLAVVANALGQHGVALEASAKAIHLFTGDAEYEAVAADAALRLPDAATARSALEGIVAAKDTPVLRVALARLCLKLNDPEAARLHVRRALELEPQHVAARELAGQLGIAAP